LLDGGFPCGRITEVCGQPGIGKTQFCLQTCLTVQLPKWCSGLSGEAVFIDTEGSFMTKRLFQMGESLVTHCNKRIVPELKKLLSLSAKESADTDEGSAYAKVLASLPTPESLLRGVHYIRCTDYLQLLAATRRLPDFCRYHPDATVNFAKLRLQVRLIVVDSVALPFRYEFDCIPQRNRLLAALSQALLSVAGSQNAAVIVTNQITTRFNAMDGRDTSFNETGGNQLVPALGDSWGHICSIRLLLERSFDDRGQLAKLLKHPGRPPGTARYQVTVRLFDFWLCPGDFTTRLTPSQASCLLPFGPATRASVTTTSALP
uniref:DNA repair protein RAD51 homolog 3 n=1 Tax=Schistocephalus solidus TaxID=70667 RepID=A0A183S7G4_SCHSO